MGQINVIRINKSPFLIFTSDQQVVRFSRFTYEPKSRRKSLVEVLGVCVSTGRLQQFRNWNVFKASSQPAKVSSSLQRNNLNVKKVALLISVCVPVNSINIYLLLQKLQEGECKSQQDRWWDLWDHGFFAWNPDKDNRVRPSKGP